MSALVALLAALLVGAGHGAPARHHHPRPHRGPVLVSCRVDVGCTVTRA